MNTLESKPNPVMLRKLINLVLITDSDLDAFCQDYFPSVKRRFTDGMDRVKKVSLLLETGEVYEVLKILKSNLSQEIQKCGDDEIKKYVAAFVIPLDCEDYFVAKSERILDSKRKEIPNRFNRDLLRFLLNRFSLIIGDEDKNSSQRYETVCKHLHGKDLPASLDELNNRQLYHEIHQKTAATGSQQTEIISTRRRLHAGEEDERKTLAALAQAGCPEDAWLTLLAKSTEPGIHVSLSLYPDLERALVREHSGALVHSLLRVQNDEQTAAYLITYSNTENNKDNRKLYNKSDEGRLIKTLRVGCESDFFIIRPYGGLILDDQSSASDGLRKIVPPDDLPTLSFSEDALLSLQKEQTMFWTRLDNVILRNMRVLPALVLNFKATDWSRVIYSWLHANKRPRGYQLSHKTDNELEFKIIGSDLPNKNLTWVIADEMVEWIINYRKILKEENK